MTRTHEIKLDGYGAHTTLAEDRPIMLLGTAESYGIETLHVVSGKSWEGLTVTATFNAPDGTSTDILMDTDGNVVVPSEATAKSGSGKIVFTGVSDGVQRISCDLEYFVVAHSAINGVHSGGTAPSWFEQAATRFMPSGGTAGQVLTKLTDTDFDAKWQDSQGGSGAGLTPTIGDNGNWYLGDADTGKPSRGEQGPKGDTGDVGPQGPKGATGATGADGKSAFSYAQDGGYTGTEAEFAAKLAAESIDKALFVVNITTTDGVTYSADKTFDEITQAYNEGKYNIVAVWDGLIMPLSEITESVRAIFGCISGNDSFLITITYENKVREEGMMLATIHEKLPNPYPLTFTGAVNETYDGSAPVSVNIPSGGTGGGGALSGLTIADNYDIELISHVIIDQNNIPTAGITVTQKDDGSPFAYDGLLIWTDAKSAISYTTFNVNGYTDNPIEMTHGNRNLMSMYITDGTTMSIIVDRVRNIIKQSYADTGNIFYPEAIFQRVPEKFTSFKIGADGIASVKFYKAWGLTRK